MVYMLKSVSVGGFYRTATVTIIALIDKEVSQNVLCRLCVTLFPAEFMRVEEGRKNRGKEITEEGLESQ